MTPQLTPIEIEELNIAIAEGCGWKVENYGPEGYETLYWRLRRPDGTIREHGCTGEDWSRKMFSHMIPPYTTSIDAIRQAAIDRFRTCPEKSQFEKQLLNGELTGPRFIFIRTALDWSIAYARTAKIWKYKQQ